LHPSGPLINFQKSSLVFFPNANHANVNPAKGAFNISAKESLEKYLGYPRIIGAKK